MMCDRDYIPRLFDAYKRGFELRYKEAEKAPEWKDYYFKLKDDLPRVQVVLGFLQGIVPMGQCQSLLDVGSGRGVFLFPTFRVKWIVVKVTVNPMDLTSLIGQWQSCSMTYS